MPFKISHLFVVVLAFNPLSAAEIPPPPLAGKYVCVQNGMTTTSPMAGVPMQITPAPMANLFGDLILDGSGGYRMTGGKNVVGRFARNGASGAINFTGLLAGFSNHYAVRDGRVFFDFNAGAISMSCSRGGSTYKGNSSARTQTASNAVKKATGSPNGAMTGTLYYSKSDGIYALNLEQGQERFLREGYAFDIAPDGQMIWVNKAGELMQGATSGPARKIETYGRNAEPRFSPDGGRIVYMGEVRDMSVSGSLMGAYTTANVQPLVIDRTGRVIAQFGAEYMQPTWTSDGRIVVAGTKASGSLMGNAATGIFLSDAKLRRLTRIDPGYELPHDPAISPDGSKVAFVSGRSIVVMGLDGSNPQSIADGQTQYVGSPAWSPDGSAIVFRDNRQVFVVPANGKPRPVNGNEGFQAMAWGNMVWSK